MALERGFRRVVLALSLAAALAGGWISYDEVQAAQVMVCFEIGSARQELALLADAIRRFDTSPAAARSPTHAV